MILKNKIQGFIFDFDGTLLDSLGMWNNLDNVYLDERNISIPEDLAKSIEGMSFTETAQYFKDRFKLKESVQDIVGHWHEHIKEVYPFLPFKDGALPFVERIFREGYKLALATSNSRSLVVKALDQQEFLKFFPVIVTSDDVGRGKPSPDVFLEAAARIKLHAKNCLVIEDTLMGVLGAKRAGMVTVAIYDYHNRHNWQEITDLADFTIRSYSELDRLLI